MCRLNRFHVQERHIDTTQLLRKLHLQPIDYYIHRRQLRWFGDIARMHPSKLPRKMLLASPLSEGIKDKEMFYSLPWGSSVPRRDRCCVPRREKNLVKAGTGCESDASLSTVRVPALRGSHWQVFPNAALTYECVEKNTRGKTRSRASDFKDRILEGPPLRPTVRRSVVASPLGSGSPWPITGGLGTHSAHLSPCARKPQKF
jgi:hypothetical protein